MTRKKTLLLLVLALLTMLPLACGPSDDQSKKATEKAVEVGEQGKATVAAPTQVPSGGSGQQAKPTAEPTKMPTEAPTQAATQAPKPTIAATEESADLSEVAGIEGLDSYRMTSMIAWKQVKKDGTTEEGVLNMLEEFDRATRARRYKISGSAPSDDGTSESGDVEMIQIGTSSYMRSGDEWVSAQVDPSAVDVQASMLPDANDLPTGEGTYVGSETVNGVSAKHYRYEESEFSGVAFGDVDHAELDLWVSEEYKVVVKAETSWEGEDDEGTQWSGTMKIDVTDINQPIVIEPPEGVEAPAWPEDVPLMEGATNVSSVVSGTGVNTYEIAVPCDQVVAFYDEEMPTNGWEIKDRPDPAMHIYVKGNRQAMLLVGEQDGGCGVTIMIGEEE